MSSQVSYVTIHTISVHLNSKVIENWSINSACPFSPLLNGARDLVKNDKEVAEVFKTFFTSVFTSKTGLWQSQAPETTGTIWIKEDLSLVEKDQAKEHFNKLDIC